MYCTLDLDPSEQENNVFLDQTLAFSQRGDAEKPHFHQITNKLSKLTSLLHYFFRSRVVNTSALSNSTAHATAT
jgi:hypothetical protein